MNLKKATELVRLYEEHDRIKGLRERVQAGTVGVSVKIWEIQPGPDNGRTIFSVTDNSAEGERVAGMADHVRAKVAARMKDQLDTLKGKIMLLGGETP